LIKQVIKKAILSGIMLGLILTILVGVYDINLEISNKKSHSTEIISNIAALENHTRFLKLFFNQSMNYIELLEWVDKRMEWVPNNETFERHEDVFKILENGTGRGRCGEHSYVYAAACWAHGYETRLVAAFLNGDHAWTEVKINGSWIHVDPSPPQRVNDPHAYDKKFYLFVFSYEANGKSQYLMSKYNPVF